MFKELGINHIKNFINNETKDILNEEIDDFEDEVSRDVGPGNAVLYGTTQEFLERMGINSVTDLPPLGEFVPGPEVVEALERSLRVVSDEVTIPSNEEG